MAQAFVLVEKGRGLVHPNPLVGALVVKNGEIIGRGFHSAFGAAHAEVEAINDAKKTGGDRACEGSNLYVTLEPCCHIGKTPPCTDAVIQSGTHHVTHAIEDPNPEVAGKSRDILEQAGITVEPNVSRDRALEQNRAYFRFRKTGLPWVTWKIALTPDDQLTFTQGERTQITGPEADAYVDELRSKTDAVLIGSSTAKIDNPGLRVRNGKGRDPYRVVFDTKLSVSLDLKLIKGNFDNKTIIVTTNDQESAHKPYIGQDVEIITVRAAGGRIDLRRALSRLADKGIFDILMEAGMTLGEAMIEDGLVQSKIILQSADVASAKKEFKDAMILGNDLGTEIKISN